MKSKLLQSTLSKARFSYDRNDRSHNNDRNDRKSGFHIARKRERDLIVGSDHCHTSDEARDMSCMFRLHCFNTCQVSQVERDLRITLLV